MSREIERQDAARHQRSAKRKKRKNRKIVIFIIEILVLIILAAVLYGASKLSIIQQDTTVVPENIEVNEGLSDESQEIMSNYTTIALFGLDNRSNGNLSKGNSDVIMIATINDDTQEVTLVSVYRDTYLDVGKGSFRKCNAAYANGGPEQAISMLNTNLDLNITDYVTVDFNAVVECVDLLGGVELTITDEEAYLMQGYQREISEMTDTPSPYLSSGGTYNLDGVQACSYARIRYTSGGDFTRAERQRTVLAAMVEKAQRSDLKTLNSLIDKVFGDIQTSYSSTEMAAMGAKIFGYHLGETAGFPFLKGTTMLGSKGDVVVPCELTSNVVELHKFLYGDEAYVPTDTVTENSAIIKNDTGLSEADGY